MPFSADNLRFFAGAARNLEGKSAAEYVEGYTSLVRREPLGIVAGITPWNYPLMMAVWKMGPALAAGNVQILKPAEQTPLTTLRLVELAQEFLPPGVLQVVTGDGIPVGDALVKHPEVQLVSLTGDVATGKIIAANAAQTLKRVHLELGGKAPMVALDDADPATVAEAIKIGGYWSSGQDCTASSRILVDEKIYDDVLSESVKVVEGMKVADPADSDDVDMGPLISREQQERVLGFLERASDAKATIVTGGASLGDRGFFVKPTIVTDVSQTPRSSRTRSSGRSSRSSRSRPTTRRSRWRTACATGWPHRCSARTSAGRSRSRGGSTSERCGSTSTCSR
jgi:betaine-aldehyde dehydrogenase/aminobutyraldehyde dehydrogenase